MNSRPRATAALQVFMDTAPTSKRWTDRPAVDANRLRAGARAELDSVAWLLDRGADPNGGAADWARPLAWAAAMGRTEVAELLRRRGAQPVNATGA